MEIQDLCALLRSTVSGDANQMKNAEALLKQVALTLSICFSLMSAVRDNNGPRFEAFLHRC